MGKHYSQLVKRYGEDAALDAAWQAIEAGVPGRLAFWKRVLKAIKVLQVETPDGSVLH